jgi:hypothetical protein
MATDADVKRIALSLPGAEQVPGRFAFAVTNKGKAKPFVWVWMERVNPKKPRVANFEVVAVRVSSMDEKARLLEEDSIALFDEPHYAGFPGLLVRLRKIRVPKLRRLITDAWRCQAPTDLKKRPR